MDNENVEYRLRKLFEGQMPNNQTCFSELMSNHRLCAIDQVVEQGLPTKRVESYRQTDIRAMYDSDLELLSCECLQNKSHKIDLPIDSIRIEIYNGCYVGQEKLTITNQGVVFGSLAEAACKYPYVVGKYVNSTQGKNDVVGALNTAFIQDGLFLYVPSGVRVDLPITIIESYFNQMPAMTFGRTLMVFEANSECTVILNSSSECSHTLVSNGVREIFAESGANVNIVDIQQYCDEFKNIVSTYVVQSSDSNVKSVSLTLDGSVVRNNLTVKLNGRGAENQTYGLALSSRNQHIDYFTNIEHISSDAVSRQKFKSTASESGRVVFNGRIYVAQDAQRTQAFQENRNLLLSDTAKIYAKPQLEIYADDVKCSHGATVGQLNAEEIYYMRQRGLSEADAKRLQVYGFVNEIISRVDNPQLIELLNELATAKIERL